MNFIRILVLLNFNLACAIWEMAGRAQAQLDGKSMNGTCEVKVPVININSLKNH